MDLPQCIAMFQTNLQHTSSTLCAYLGAQGLVFGAKKVSEVLPCLLTGHTPSPPPLHEWLFIAQIAAAAGAAGEGGGGRGAVRLSLYTSAIITCHSID